jgi:hypothetical protein
MTSVTSTMTGATSIATKRASKLFSGHELSPRDTLGLFLVRTVSGRCYCTLMVSAVLKTAPLESQACTTTE